MSPQMSCSRWDAVRDNDAINVAAGGDSALANSIRQFQDIHPKAASEIELAQLFPL
ncbi:MAG: hypothetical protein ACN6P5_03665 [Pseudomonas protegens]